MRLLPLLLAAAVPAVAHMVSISTGEMQVDGSHIHYQMRLPYYEVEHIQVPEKTLVEAVTFRSHGVQAHPIERKCTAKMDEKTLVCEVELELPSPPDEIEVHSSLPEVIVTNHVHLLRAGKGGRTDQAVLDYSFPTAILRFRPPGMTELATREFTAGALRAAGGLAPLLFLVALTIAARSRRELLVLTAMFLAGELLASLLLPLTGWQPPPRFVEAAAALTIAYLAVEVLLLPQAGERWLVVAALGAIHGLYFSTFLLDSGFHAAWVLSGVAFAELLLIALFALLFSRFAKWAAAWRPERAASAVLLVIGIGWFVIRMRG